MATYADIEYLVQIPKIIEILLFVICAIRIYKIKKYILNKVFFSAFLVWTIYTASDLIMWTHAADSETWYTICNVIRDIQLAAASIFAFLIYFSTQIIVHGLKGLNKPKIIIIGIIFLIVVFFVDLWDQLEITTVDGTLIPIDQWDVVIPVIVSANLGIVTAILIAFPLVLYVISVVELSTLVKTRIKETDLKKRMIFLIVGISLVPIGIIWFAVALSIPILYNVYTISFGRIIWMISPILILYSQIQKKDN